MCETPETTFYTALSGRPNPLATHEVDESLYHDAGAPETGMIKVTTPFTGKIPSNEYDLNCATIRETNEYNIAWTKWGTKGPPVLFIHGVPTNRRQWYPIQKRVAKFARTLSIDLLGMGESDKPLEYGQKELMEFKYCNKEASRDDPWDWKFDQISLRQIIEAVFPGEKVAVVADDWGGGVATWLAALNNDLVASLTKVNSIDFDGYPVSEIQAIGRASALSNKKFMEAMGAIDQTLVQIFKTMVHDQAVYNQYNLRDIKFPYVDVDYERSLYNDGEDATSMTLRIKYNNARVLADRARVLAPVLLLPFDCQRNLRGVPVDQLTMRILVINSGPNGDVGVKITGDSMMPSSQVWLNLYAYPKATSFNFHYVESAGHFVGTDRPRLVAEYVIVELINTFGRSAMADICLGFTGLWKGDEANKLQQLRTLYGI